MSQIVLLKRTLFLDSPGDRESYIKVLAGQVSSEASWFDLQMATYLLDPPMAFSLDMLTPDVSFFLLRIFVVCCCSLPTHVQFFATSWTRACQASLSFIVSQRLPKFMYVESVMPSNSLILCCSPAFNLSQHQGFFPVSQLFSSGCQSIGVSALASVLPVSIQG